MQHFGTTPEGQEVHRLTLRTGALEVSLLTLGACLQEVRLPGLDRNLTLGFPSLAPYLTEVPSAGTLMGPVANRITGARAVIDGTEHLFDKDFLGAHTLHGGSAATHAQIWQIAEMGAESATLALDLLDGAGGFPGNRRITARFAADAATLSLHLSATTDRPTLMNLANHSYWNLGPEPTTRGHTLTVPAAAQYLPTTSETELLPTGQIAPVEGTRFDYRAGRAIEAGAEGLLDTNLCLAPARQALRQIATLTAPDGTTMTMASTEPGLQVFDGHILRAVTHATTDGRQPGPYAALALEAQAWPDAPNHTGFPKITLRTGETYQQTTTWTFAP